MEKYLCDNCNSEVTATQKFCNSCGSRFLNDTTSDNSEEVKSWMEGLIKKNGGTLVKYRTTGTLVNNKGTKRFSYFYDYLGYTCLLSLIFGEYDSGVREFYFQPQVWDDTRTHPKKVWNIGAGEADVSVEELDNIAPVLKRVEMKSNELISDMHSWLDTKPQKTKKQRPIP